MSVATVERASSLDEPRHQLLALPEDKFVQRWPKLSPSALPKPVRDACIKRYVDYLARTYPPKQQTYEPGYNDYQRPLSPAQRVNVQHAIAILAAIAEQFPRQARDEMEHHIAAIQAWAR